MRIIQIVESFTYGDAIGDHVTALHKGFQQQGVESEIYALYVEERMRKLGKQLDGYKPQPADTIILHVSIGSPINLQVTEYQVARLVVDYHNITPPEFFEGYSDELAQRCHTGREQIRELAPHVDLALADSAYNAQELVNAGFTCPVHVAPILLDFAKYQTKPNQKIVNKLAARRGTKLLFCGRVVPNKCQHIVIQAFYEYKRLYDPLATLTFVGGYGGAWEYYLRLRKYLRKLGLSGVYFTGHTPFEDMIAYYQASDVFVCESAHEGFCVPLIEAMNYRLPIVAYGGSAVGETLGEGGIALPNQDPNAAAHAIHELMCDDVRRDTIKAAQTHELARFDAHAVLTKFFKVLGLE